MGADNRRGRPAESEGDSNLSPARLAWQRKAVGATARALVEADARHFLHQSLSSPCLTAIRRAEGIWIEDVEGRRYMDFHGNNVHNVGYGHPRLKEAIRSQMDELPFTPRRYTAEPAIALARRLAEIAPGDLGKVLFTTGGSDAIEVAMKLARAATGRHKFVSFWDSFHGAGFGASSIGGEHLFHSAPFGPLLPGTEHVAPFACYRCAYGYPDLDGQPDLARCRMTCASYLRYVLEKEGEVAAVVAEPVRAVPYVPPPDYWRSIRQACDEHGTLLIFDEIPMGLGRTGRMFACEHFDVVPDILVLGKSLGGGLVPMAAVIARPDLDVGADWAFGHYTHEKNPVICRAALTTLQIIEEEGLAENACRVGEYALERLQAMRERYPVIGNVCGIGLILGVELVRDRATKEPASDDAEAVMYRCLEGGLSFKTTMGNVLTLSPPLTITRDEMRSALDILESAIAEAQRDLGAG